MTFPIHGLVLAGGESRRMGRDKAMLRYNGQATQLERGCGLLAEVCERVFVSHRPDQDFSLPAQVSAIRDEGDELRGPLRGIVSALRAHPEAHWLVLACDLPRLDRPALEKLIARFRQSPPRLLAYRSSHDGLPEPLCAIYPSGCDEILVRRARERGTSCPRKILILEKAELVEQDDPRSLDNINTPEEFSAILRDYAD